MNELSYSIMYLAEDGCFSFLCDDMRERDSYDDEQALNFITADIFQAKTKLKYMQNNSPETQYKIVCVSDFNE